jgi:hypothetical protein
MSTKTKHPSWVRHLDGIADELMRLSIICKLRLKDPGVIDRILKNDESVCGSPNPAGFRKLRGLVVATYSSLNLAIDRIGPEETKMITDAIIERLDRLRSIGGTAGPDSAGSTRHTAD